MVQDTQWLGSQSRKDDREFAYTDKQFWFLSDLVKEKTGIVLKEHKKNMVYGRLARRLRALGLKSFDDYLSYLADERNNELGSLINAITTNLTRFFREEHHFNHLRNVVLPEAIRAVRKGEQDRIRIWSAGCSSGEEPYTIAMVLDAALREARANDLDAKILATDLDTNMLDHGRQGIYKIEDMSAIPSEYHRFFSPQEDRANHYLVSRQLRARIAFKELNLLGTWPMKGKFDAIFCRNVMIYFDNPTKAQLTKRYGELIKEQGWFFVGHSETVLGENNPFKLIGRTTYQKQYI